MELYFVILLFCGSLVTHCKPLTDRKVENEKLPDIRVEYKCKGEVAFHLNIKTTIPQSFNLSICKSSWYNDWCEKPGTEFIESKCLSPRHYDEKEDSTTKICVFDRAIMCDNRLIASGGSWFYSTYVVRLIGFSAKGRFMLGKIPLSPFQSEYQCPSFSLLNNERNQKCHH